MLGNGVLPLAKNFVHHRSLESLAKSALDDCAICRTLWDEMNASRKRDLQQIASQTTQATASGQKTSDYFMTYGNLSKSSGGYKLWFVWREEEHKDQFYITLTHYDMRPIPSEPHVYDDRNGVWYLTTAQI